MMLTRSPARRRKLNRLHHFILGIGIKQRRNEYRTTICLRGVPGKLDRT